jgi:hypothetical protein
VWYLFRPSRQFRRHLLHPSCNKISTALVATIDTKALLWPMHIAAAGRRVEPLRHDRQSALQWCAAQKGAWWCQRRHIHLRRRPLQQQTQSQDSDLPRQRLKRSPPLRRHMMGVVL